MNIAIVIGVSNYLNPKDNLPGSKNDAETIFFILKKTQKFEEILYINNDQNSASTKVLITNFISSYKGKDVDEFFFYYSGHGEFVNSEFYYILSDFDAKKRNQTSLQNKEVDDLIKTLTPSIVIKVIDACQSGTFYIKEIGILSKYLAESQNGFKKCYFLNSSLNSQASYASDQISFFTASFVNAIKEHKSDEIRYKDIIDIISDEFSNNQEQTPLFVIQADLTEKFCFINKELKSYLLTANNTNEKEPEESKSLSLQDLIKIDAESYATKEEVIVLLNKLQSTLDSIRLNEILETLYTVRVSFWDDNGNIPDKYTIERWLNNNDHDYFVQPIYEDNYDDYVGEFKDLVGFDLNMEVPFKSVSIDLVSNYPNISSYRSDILYFISKKNIRFFYFTTNFIDKNWDEKDLNYKSIKWFTTEYIIGKEADVIYGLEKILDSIQNQIIGDLEEKFKPEGDEDELPF